MRLDTSAAPSRTGAAVRVLFAALVAVNALYLAATGYSQHTAYAIDAAATRITRGVTASIEHLAEARGEIRHLETLIDLELDRTGPARRVPLDEARMRLRGAVAAYLVIPPEPEERDLERSIGRALPALDRAFGTVIDRLATGDRAGARGIVEAELRPAATRSGRLLLGAIDVNARIARGLARDIGAVRRRSMHIAIGLDAVSVLLTALIGIAAFRRVTAYESLLEAHGRRAEERADELEQFAGRVAHDIKSPLSSVSLAFQLVGRRTRDDLELRDAVARGRASLGRVVRIVEDLLAFARAAAHPAEGAQADVTAVASDAVSEWQPAAEAAGIVLALESDEPSAVACSLGVLTSLVSNLIQNAIKYIGESPVRRITVRVLDRHPVVRVEVEDTGPGLAPQLRERVFEPYVRAPGATGAGLGLGLATVRRLARAYGGDAGVTPADGTGCRFWFELPKAAPALPGRVNRHAFVPAPPA